MKNTEEARMARLFEETILYLSLYESPKAKRLPRIRRCVPFFGNGVDCFRREIVKITGGPIKADVACDAITPSLGLINGSVFGEEDSGEYWFERVSEVWGQERSAKIAHFNSIRPKDVRWIHEDARIAHVNSVFIRKDGMASRDQTHWFRFQDGHWSAIGTIDRWQNPSLGHAGLALVPLSQFAIRENWSVELGMGDSSATASLITDAVGVKEFFRLRDIPPGKSRRSALLHWVESHWRRLRNDPTSEAFVRKHLRGARSFRWFDMNVSIGVPRNESEIEQKAKNERKLMVILGTRKSPVSPQRHP